MNDQLEVDNLPGLPGLITWLLCKMTSLTGLIDQVDFRK